MAAAEEGGWRPTRRGSTPADTPSGVVLRLPLHLLFQRLSISNYRIPYSTPRHIRHGKHANVVQEPRGLPYSDARPCDGR